MKIISQHLVLIFFSIIAATFPSLAQNDDFALAEEYYQQQAYDKAQEIYTKLARRDDNLDRIYPHYLHTLVQLKDFREAEKLVKRQIKNNAYNPAFRIDLAWIDEVQGQKAKAEKAYEDIIKDIRKMNRPVYLASEHFIKMGKLDWAARTFLAAREAQKSDAVFAPELADVYYQSAQKKEMIREYLLYAVTSSSSLDFVKGALQDRLSSPEDFDLLENSLLDRIQDKPNEITYNELLLWLYIQQKRFYRAFIQAKAIDKRYRLEGVELLQLGLISLRNEDYKNASKIFEYVIEAYPSGDNYTLARNYYIKSKEELVKNTFPINTEEIRLLIGDYQALLNDVGRNYRTISTMRNMALLHAFYLSEEEEAITVLNEAIQISRGNADFVAQCKIDLGDIYLLKGEPWESTLLYSQAEKLKKDHPIGYEAKLRNARLSYFRGDFRLAKEHLDILKEATTREIANDAMDLSLRIQDNTVFDTSGTALKAFAEVELMVFQHQETEALARLSELADRYKTHSLADEILWEKANLLLKLARPEEAVKDLKAIVEQFGEDILGDDAHFLLAKTYEEQIKDKEQAMELYKQQMLKYPGSIYTAEARKRFRTLRGDFVSQ